MGRRRGVGMEILRPLPGYFVPSLLSPFSLFLSPPLLAFLAELRTGTAKLNERRKDRFDVGAARAQVIYFPRMRRATTGGMFFDYVRWTC